MFGLTAIDVPPDADLRLIRQLLDIGQRDGWWDYDELCVTDAWNAATTP
jgi:myo-inositol catabolism protein IolC